MAKDAKDAKGAGPKPQARNRAKGQVSNQGVSGVAEPTTPSIWLVCNFGFSSEMADAIVDMWGDGKW